MDITVEGGIDMVTWLRLKAAMAEFPHNYDAAADEIVKLRGKVRELETYLQDASDAFDECTGDHAKDIVQYDDWRVWLEVNSD